MIGLLIMDKYFSRPDRLENRSKHWKREEALRNTIQDQIVLEIAKLQRLERQAHPWVQQALPSLDKLDTIYPQMKRLLEAAEEKDQFLGPDMESIADLPIQEKMSTLSIITTLTIDIQKVLQSWTEFQHQLVVTAEAIIEVCIPKRTTIRLCSP